MKIASQFAKYVSVALLSAASDWVVFAALFAAFASPIMAQAISRIVGAIVSFGINKYWSFGSLQHKRALTEAWRFVVLFIASYSLSLSLFSAFTFWGMSPYLAKLITDTACFFFNFLIMRTWVYRPQDTEVDGAVPARLSEPSRHRRLAV